MAKQLTNKQIETLAKAIVRQVTKVASKKASKDPKANKLLKDLEALDKKIAKMDERKDSSRRKARQLNYGPQQVEQGNPN
jgi:superfamily I DNA and RNA helicase